MLANLRVANHEFRSWLNLSAVIVQWFVVEPSHEKLFLVVTGFDADPHPFPDASDLIGKLDLDVVALLVCRHCRSQRAVYTRLAKLGACDAGRGATCRVLVRRRRGPSIRADSVENLG